MMPTDEYSQPFKTSGPLNEEWSPGNQWLPPRFTTRLPWQFGKRCNRGWKRWFSRSEQPFFLELDRHQGIVLGTTERGIDMTLLRLATNAARCSWKVILFDALGSETGAATFLAAMHQVGCHRTHVFPNEPYNGWRGSTGQILERLLQMSSFREPYYQHLATICLSTILGDTPIASMDELVRRLTNLVQVRRGGSNASPAHFPSILRAARPFDVAGPPLRYGALRTLVGNRLDGTWSYEDTDAAYFSFNTWAYPQQAHSLATFLLADLAGYLTERSSGQGRVLLLIKRPDLLLDREQLALLFAHMERMGGRAFVAVRSTADLGNQAAHILSHARTLLVHRGSTSLQNEPSIRLPWWGQLAMEGTIRRLPNDECLVIHDGEVTHVRIDPVVSETADVLRAHAGIPLQPKHPLVQSTWGGASSPLPPAFQPFHSAFTSSDTSGNIDEFTLPGCYDEVENLLDLPEEVDLSSVLLGEEECEEQEEKGTLDPLTSPPKKGPSAVQNPHRARSKRSSRKKGAQNRPIAEGDRPGSANEAD